MTLGDIVLFKGLGMVDVLKYAITPLFAYIGYLFKKWTLERQTNKFKLPSHNVFRNITQSENEIDRWSAQANRKVFIDALGVMYQHWKDNGLSLACKLESGNKMTSSEIEQIFNDYVNETVKGYNSDWEKLGIPELIVRRINEQNEDKIKMFLAEISLKCHNSDQYPFFKNKVISIFDTLNVLLSEVKNNFNELIYRTNYNGELLGVTYRGEYLSDREFQAKGKIKC